MRLKSFLFVALTALASQSAAAGEIRADMLPDPVKNAFASLYPSVVAVEWDWDEDRHAYEAEAKIDHREVEVLIAETGELLQAKEDVFADQIPDEVLKEIRQKWPRAEVLGANKITTRSDEIWDVGLKFRNRYHNVEIKRKTGSRR